MAALLGVAALLPATASAADIGGAQLVDGNAQAPGTERLSSGGGLTAPGMPSVKDAHCLSRCVSGHKATPGATIRVSGASLDYVARIVFRGKDGPVKARYTYRTPGVVKTRVPVGAVSSRPYVVDHLGKRSNRSPTVLEVLPPSMLPVEIFPIRGPHQYWDGWGAGRNHQGADIGAACGTRLVSALAGRVQYTAYQSAAGNYAVVDVRNSNVDIVYMHMIRPAAVREGQRVGAGDTIGYVGETGNASGCHLHFEYWRGDWWGGGSAVDPVPYLKAWDRKS